MVIHRNSYMGFNFLNRIFLLRINYYDKSFGYCDFEKIRFLMPWIVEFTFEDKKCVGIRMHNLFEH